MYSQINELEPIKPLGCEVEADEELSHEFYEPEHKYFIPDSFLYSPYSGAHCAPHLMYNAKFNFYLHPLQPKRNNNFERLRLREPITLMPHKHLPVVEEFVTSGKSRVRNHDYENYNLCYVRSFKLSQTLNDHTGCVNGVKMSDDGELLITCSDDLHLCIYQGGCNVTEETWHNNYWQSKQNTSAPALPSSSFIRPESYPDNLSSLSQSYWQLRTRLATPHRSNIFHASFIFHDASHSHVLTCGNDGLTLLMDVEYNSIVYKVCAGEWACSIATSPWSPFVSYVAYGQGVIACIDTRLPSHSIAQLDNCNSTTTHHHNYNSVNTHVTRSKNSSYGSWSYVIDVEPVILTPCAGVAQSINALAMHHMYPFTLALGTNSEYVFFADVRMGSGRSYAALTLNDDDDNDCYNTRLSTLPTHNSTTNRRSRGNIRPQAAHRSISVSDGISGLSFSERGDWLAVNYRSEDIYLCPWVAQLRRSQINVATTHDLEKCDNLCDLEEKFNASCKSTPNKERNKRKNIRFSRANEGHDISRVHGNASASEQNSINTRYSTKSKKIKHEQQEINASASIVEHTPEYNEPQTKSSKVYIPKSKSNNMHHVPFVTSFPCNTNYHSFSCSSLPLYSSETLESKTEKYNVGVSWLECCGGTLIPVVMSERKNARQLTGRENVSTMFKEVIFMEDDRYVCSGGDDGNVYVWHAASGTLLAQWHADEDVVNGVLYHAQRRQLITCGIDTSTKVFASSFFGNENLYLNDDDDDQENNEKENTSSDDSMTKSEIDAISHNNDIKHLIGHTNDCLSSHTKLTKEEELEEEEEEEQQEKVTSTVSVAAESTQATTIQDCNLYQKEKKEATIDTTIHNNELNRTESSSSSPLELKKEDNHCTEISNRHVCENNDNKDMVCTNTRIETPRIIAMTSEQAIALRKHFRIGNLQHAVIASLYRQFNKTKFKSCDDDHAQEQLSMPHTFVLSLTNVLAARSSVLRIRERLFHGEYFVSLGDNILSMIINNFLGSNNTTNVNSEASSLEDENYEEHDLSSWEEASNTYEYEHQLHSEEEEEEEQRYSIEELSTISRNIPEEEEQELEYYEEHEHEEENEEQQEEQEQNLNELTINSHAHDHTTTTNNNNNNTANNNNNTRADEVIVVQIQPRSSRGENRVQLIPIRDHRAHQSSTSLLQLINQHHIHEERVEAAPHGHSSNTSSSSSSSSQNSDTSVELELEQFPNIAAFYAANNINYSGSSDNNNEFHLGESHVRSSNDRYDGYPGKDDFVQFRANSWNKLTESVAQMQEMISSLIANWVIRKENNSTIAPFTNKESIFTSTTADDVDTSHVCSSRYAKGSMKSKTRKCAAVTRKNAKQKNESINKNKIELKKKENTKNEYGKLSYHHIIQDREQVQICEWNRCLFAHYTNDISELQGKHNNKLIPTESRLLLDNVWEDVIREHMNEAHVTSSTITAISNIENTGDESMELADEAVQTRNTFDSSNNDNNTRGINHNESSENEVDVSNSRNRHFANEYNEMQTTFEQIEQESSLSSSSSSFSSSSSSTEPNMYALLSEEDLQHTHTTRQNIHIENNNNNNNHSGSNDNDNVTHHANSHVNNVERTKSLSYHQLNAMMLYYLLHVLDILLQGRDAFTCSAEERRVYWEWRKWLEFHYIYLFMAVGNVESALRHCAHLDDWFEFADCVELGGCTLAQAIECVHHHNTYSLDSSSFEFHNSVNTTTTNNNNNNNIINDVDSMHNYSNCKISSLNTETKYNQQIQDNNQISNRKKYNIEWRNDSEQTQILSRNKHYESIVKKSTRGKSTKNTKKINDNFHSNVANSNKLFNKAKKFAPEMENCRKGQNDNLETDIEHNVMDKHLLQNTTTTTCKTNELPFHPLRYTTWRFVPPVYHDQTMMEMVNVTKEVMPKGSNGERGALSQEIVLPPHNAKAKHSSIPHWKSTKASNNKNNNGGDDDDDIGKRKKRKQLQSRKLINEAKLSRKITSTRQSTKLNRARKSTSKNITEKYETISNKTEPLNKIRLEEEEEEHLHVWGHQTYFPKLLIPLALQVRILHLAISWLRRTLLTLTMNEVHANSTTTNHERYKNCDRSKVNENITQINDDIDRYEECLKWSLVELKDRLEMHPNTEVCEKVITMLRELNIDVEYEKESVEITEGEEKLPTQKKYLLNRNSRNK